MFDIPGLSGRQPDTKASVEAGAKTGAETPSKQAAGELTRVFTEAFGPQTNPLDVSVVSQKNGYRVIVNQALVPAKEQMKIFGLPLPFQRRERGAVPTALANLNVSAKRRIFRKLFKYKGSQRMYFKDLKDARALAEFVADCKEKLGNPEPAAKSDADVKTKREAAVKSGPPPSPLAGLPGMGAGAPPGLAGMGGAPPGMPGGLPGMPGGLPGGAPGAGLPPGLMAGLGGGRPPGRPGGGMRMPGGLPGGPGGDDGMPA